MVQLTVVAGERDRYARECEALSLDYERLKQKLTTAGGAKGELDGKLEKLQENYEKERVVCDELRNLFGIHKKDARVRV